ESPCSIPLMLPITIAPLPMRGAIDHPITFALREFVPRHIQANVFLRRVTYQVVLDFLEARTLPRPHRTFPQGFGFVRHHQAIIDADNAAKPPAGLTSPQG